MPAMRVMVTAMPVMVTATVVLVTVTVTVMGRAWVNLSAAVGRRSRYSTVIRRRRLRQPSPHQPLLHPYR